MSAGDIKTRGQKGNNHPFQFKILKLLGSIVSSISGSATEATLQDILTNLDFDFDPVTGALLVQQNNQESSVGTSTVVSTNTSFFVSDSIDLRSYSAISIVPNVTIAGGTIGEYKIQWSFDNSNWFDETIDEPLNLSGGEVIINQGVMIRQFDSSGIGLKSVSSITLSKKARYIRISQRSDSAAASLTTAYNYQLFI